MKKISGALLLLAVLSVNPLVAQDEKNYDAVYLSIVKEYTLNPDGSMAFHYIKDQKLLTYRAINAFYGETFVVYNPQYQKLEINASSTTMADGKLVKAPANAFNEVLPGFAANAPAFNGLREMVITHTALERNAVIHLDYTLRTEREFYPVLAADEVLSEIEPVRSLTIRVRVPAGKSVDYKTINIKKEPVRIQEGGFSIYTWTFENVKPISAEDNQPGGNEIQPRIVFSCGQDADRTWTWFTSQPAFSSAVTESMKQEAGRLAAGGPSNGMLALKIQENVVNGINLTPVSMRYTGFRLRTPDEVWSGNYGNLPEKALLMTAMLRAAGLDALPYAVYRSQVYTGKIADLYGIEDIVVKVTTSEGTVLWLSASNLNNQQMPAAMPGRTLVPLTAEGRAQVISGEAVPGTSNLSGNLYISDKQELTGDLTVTVSGPLNPRYALLRDESKAKQWISGIAPKEIKEVRLSQPGEESSTYTFQVQKDNALKQDTALRTLILPFFSSGIESWGMKQFPSYRNSPVEVPYPLTESVGIVLTVPGNFSLLSQESDENFSNTAGSYRYELRKEAGKIIINKTVTVKHRITEPKDYPALKALFDSWNTQQQREVVFMVK